MTPLRAKMVDTMKLHRFSPKTQECYVAAVAGLANFYNQSPDTIEKAQVQTYLLYLLDKRKLAWSTCNIALSGFRFFYTYVVERKDISLCLPPRKREETLPEIFSDRELETLFLNARRYKDKVLLMTTFSAGLRVSEVVHLKVSNIDSERMLIRVEKGKGNKDRYTLLSERLLQELRLYWKKYRPCYWLFPGKNPTHPLSVDAVQKIYYRVKRRARITKEGGIHTLRHCFATHLLTAGVDPRTIQVLMGHRSISTTMRYLQVTPTRLASLKSPLDLMKFQDNQLLDQVPPHGGTL